MPQKLLITGFDPFGGEQINPAWEAVSRLPDRIGSWELEKLQVPTIFDRAAKETLQKAEAIQPRLILCIGQAGGRKGITPEMVAINLRHASIPDNAGNSPQDLPIIIDGPAAYFANIPVRRIAKAIEQQGICASVSYSAGAFVCNDLMYSVLHHTQNTATAAGFIHVPYLPQQAREGVPSMTLEDIVRGLTYAIEAI